MTLSVRLDGRVALVTGAARGMGAAHATALADRGACLVLSDRDVDVLETFSKDLREQTDAADVVLVPGDITAVGAAERMVAAAVDTFGRLDIVVHNAGIMHDFKELDDTDARDLKPYLAVNVLAPFTITKVAAPYLRQSPAGRVVFINSQWGQVPDPHSYGYMVAKSAQLGLMKALSKEFVADGVLVNAVAPGAVATRMVPDHVYDAEVDAVPLGRLGEADEVAAVVAFLASDAAGFLTGQTLPVNGGALVVGI